jgi:hypothetical protein
MVIIDSEETNSPAKKLSFEEENKEMATLKYIGDLIIDSTGSLRTIRLPDGLYVVGHQMLIAVDNEEEAVEVVKELKSEYGLN